MEFSVEVIAVKPVCTSGSLKVNIQAIEHVLPGNPIDTARTDRKSGSRRWLRWLLALPFLFAAASVLQVVVLRFVDPPLSAFMVARQFEAWGAGQGSFRVAYDWRDMKDISPHLPVAMVAAE